jgi:hypothetical protein
MKAMSNFLFVVENDESEITFTSTSSDMTRNGSNKGLQFNGGQTCNAQFNAIKHSRAPGFPFVVELTPNESCSLKLVAVVHEKKQGQFKSIPLVHAEKVA